MLDSVTCNLMCGVEFTYGSIHGPRRNKLASWIETSGKDLPAVACQFHDRRLQHAASRNLWCLSVATSLAIELPAGFWAYTQPL